MTDEFAPTDPKSGDDTPEAAPGPGTAFDAVPPDADGQQGRRPLWTYFLTPIAVIIGSFVIAGAIWWTGDDNGGAKEVDGALTAEDAASTAPATTLLAAFQGYAKEVAIDGPKFEQCLGKQETARLINAHLNRGSALGVNGTPTFFINNKMLVGAQPAAVFDELIAAELKGSPTALDGYSAAIQELAAAGRFKILDGKIDVADATIEGERTAKVMVAEFSDFQCPFCKRWTDQNVRRLRPRFGNEVALAFLHFPIVQIHANAGNASAAAICAGEQGKFWPMHDLLFARQSEWQDLK